jgi:uncharacterized protein
MPNTYDELLALIEGLAIVDTHEHLAAREGGWTPGKDVLEEWLFHYFSCDLISAGLTPAGLREVRDSSKDLLARWAQVEPYWEAARSTGYGRSLDLAARDLYGIDGVRRETIGALNEAFLAARAKGGHYEYVLKEKSRIALSVHDSDLNCDRRYFASVYRLDDFLMPRHRTQVEEMGQAVGVRVHRLADWEEAMRLTLEQSLEKGAVGLKCGVAYQRSLHFPKVDYATAEVEFNRLFAERNSPDWRDAIRLAEPVQDYMLHAILREADRRGLTFQFHTGLQEGNGNIISDSNPVHLTNLFLEYGEVKFDLFHMGYPYVMELGNLAKNFRNVFIDMCWGHIISPEAARRALVEWLDAVPANKISAFGGDYCFVDGIYGHQHLARRNVAAALAQKVQDGSMDLDRAKQIAQWVLVDNPTRLFGLTERIEAAKTAPVG